MPSIVQKTAHISENSIAAHAASKISPEILTIAVRALSFFGPRSTGLPHFAQ
jgi:hypothetical protein